MDGAARSSTGADGESQAAGDGELPGLPASRAEASPSGELPSLALPQFAANETLDSAALSFLLNRALKVKVKEEEGERRKSEEEAMVMKREEKKEVATRRAVPARGGGRSSLQHPVDNAPRRFLGTVVKLPDAAGMGLIRADEERLLSVSRVRSGQSVQPDVVTSVQTPFYSRLKGPAEVYSGDTVTHDTSVQVKISHRNSWRHFRRTSKKLKTA